MYKLHPRNFVSASITLCEAFYNYPIFEYIIPDPTYRKNNLKYLCHFLLRLGNARGEVITPTETIEGVSIWFSSDKTNISGIEAIQAGLLKLPFQVGLNSFRRFMKIGSIKTKKRAAIIYRPYWLCDMIGVNPISQKLGFGGQMFNAKLKEFDESNMPCYLETSKHSNIHFYKKFGFTVLHEYKIHNINVYCLLREPDINILKY
ncbi:MAG: GNAT family N-acetyltransferase [Desulfobulbaceae bacterium]|nr:GNAT family N-acetyltransferase [Desulfobulbaceae bacterium]